MTQKQTVLNHLRTKGHITHMIAYSTYGIARLAAVIHLLNAELPKRINSTLKTDGRGHKYAEYRL